MLLKFEIKKCGQVDRLDSDDKILEHPYFVFTRSLELKLLRSVSIKWIL